MKSNTLYDIENSSSRNDKINNLMSIAHYFAKRHTSFVPKGQYQSVLLDSEDVFSIASEAIVQAVDEYNSEKNMKLSSFAFDKAKNLIKDKYKCIYKTRNKNQIDFVASDFAVEDNDFNIMEEVFKRLDIYEVSRRLNTISKTERDIILRHLYYEESFRSICKDYKCSSVKIYNIYTKTLEKLRNLSF